MNNLASRTLDLAIQIQQIPSPTFQEKERAEFVRDLFLSEKLEDVEIDETGNVLGCHRSRLPQTSRHIRPVVVSAHLDTVFPTSVDLTIHNEGERIYGPGLGDNSLGIAGLLGLTWMLRDRRVQLPFDLWLIANVGEEGLGDLSGMKAVADRFGNKVGAYLVLEGTALGHVYHRALGVRRYRITMRSPGGHSWIDYGRPSAIHELIELSTHITRLEVPKNPRTTLNIGVIEGGTTVNTIAATASLELDLRSESTVTLESLAQDVEQLCAQSQKPGVEIKAELIGNRQAGEIPAGHPLVTLAIDCLREQGMEPKLSIGSTDANVPLSRGLPALTLGLTTGAGGHTVHEYVNVEPLKKGMEALLGVVRGIGILDF
jgi:acetylornithine deacetylase/succinyl-diaminopimelate desuccinylase-like protein